jgi:hypothetical protein
MHKPGVLRRYFRHYGVGGIALHAYMAWHLAVFAVPRERLDWWPPHESMLKSAYVAADVVTPKFLEPPAGTTAGAYRSYLEGRTPMPAHTESLDASIRRVEQHQYPPDMRAGIIKSVEKNDAGYQQRLAERKRSIDNTVQDLPAPVGSRGNPWTLAYAGAAYELARLWRRRRCKRRGSSI